MEENKVTFNQKENHFSLNHFVLWTKGWYHLTPKIAEKYNDDEEYLFEVLKRVLALDGYEYVKTKSDIIKLIAANLERYNEWAIKHNQKYLSAATLAFQLDDKMTYYYGEPKSHFFAMIMVFKTFFGWGCSAFPLYKPVYNKALWKKGLTFDEPYNNKPGRTYEQMNKVASKFNFL